MAALLVAWLIHHGPVLKKWSIHAMMPAMLAMDSLIIEPPVEEVIVDPQAWFDSPGAFELEIGCGKGGFLLARAKARPDIRMLGIEWANKFFKFAADRMARWGLTNVRVMRTDARVFVMRHLPPASVTILHLYHPDPWPKKRHHKRRLVQVDFADTVARVLVPGGRWLVQTDHADYFAHIRDVLDRHASFTEAAWDDAATETAPDFAGTNFEIKYNKEGRAIYRAAWLRTA
jgi:tRNA (guanine-N7-)-methyltransferase